MNHILVIHRGSLGDFLLLAPALALLRRKFPQARIEGLGRTEIMALLCPGILDSIASAERASLVPFFQASPDLPHREAEFFSSFDTVLAYIADPERNFEQNLERLGIKNLIVRPPFPPAGERIHVSKYLLSTIRPLLGQRQELAAAEGQGQNGRAELGPCTFLRFTEEEDRQAADLLRLALSPEKPILAIHAGSGSERKCWPPERFGMLARRLAEEKDCKIALVLGPADERLVMRMSVLRQELGCVLAHNLPLRLLACVLSKCSAYIGNDSGVTHLAAATDIPTLAIFGPTDPAIWAPLGSNIKIIAANAKCSPCTRETMWQCSRQTCLENIALQDVLLCLQKYIT